MNKTNNFANLVNLEAEREALGAMIASPIARNDILNTLTVDDFFDQKHKKIFEAIAAGCIPIYWGNEGYPEPDILNPKAIVYLDKEHPEEGLALLKKLYEDSAAYAEFAAQPRFLPGAADIIYAYYDRLETKLREILT